MESASSRPNGLQTALDMCLAPRSACMRLRATPSWVWAFGIAAGLTMIATFAISPIVSQALDAELSVKLAASPQIAQLPADARARAIAQQIALVQGVTRYSFVFVPFGLAFASALQALIMLVANAITKGDGTFGKLWALAVNAAIVGSGLASLVLMAIALIRGPDGFHSSSEISRALPGLGMLVPGAPPPAQAFLGVFNVFSIWNMVLLAIGMTIVARVPRGAAIAAAALMLVGYGCIAAAGSFAQK
jgi:hypothetical protein